MRRSTLRPLALGAVLVGLAGPVVAEATPVARTCRIVTDGKGDARDLVGVEANGPNQPNVDITSVDVASDRRNFTTVLRVASLGTALEAAPHGAIYFVSFHLGDTDYYTAAARFVDGESFSIQGGSAPEGSSPLDGLFGTNGAEATGVFDVAHNEVRVSVPVSLLMKDGPVTPGRPVTDVAAVTYVTVGVRHALGTQAGSRADRTDGRPGTYTLGAPSCVSPGR